MLYGPAVREILRAGYDPALGFLHHIAAGREALVCDLVEPLGAGVEYFVIHILLPQLAPENFTFSEENGCRLDKNGRALFYENWSDYVLAWPKCLHFSADSVGVTTFGAVIRYELALFKREIVALAN